VAPQGGSAVTAEQAAERIRALANAVAAHPSDIVTIHKAVVATGLKISDLTASSKFASVTARPDVKQALERLQGKTNGPTPFMDAADWGFVIIVLCFF
jgi:hypothetical protein